MVVQLHKEARSVEFRLWASAIHRLNTNYDLLKLKLTAVVRAICFILDILEVGASDKGLSRYMDDGGGLEVGGNRLLWQRCVTNVS